MNEIQFFLTLLLQAILPVAVSFVVGAVFAAARQFVYKMKTELGASQYSLLYEIVRTGVLYAEQSGISGAIENAGQEKKHEAINYVVRNLDKYGLNHVNVDEISRMIEAAVYDEFKKRSLDFFTVAEPEEVIPSPDAEQ